MTRRSADFVRRLRVLYLSRIARIKEFDLMSRSSINRIEIRLFIDMFDQEDQVKKKRKE